MLPRPGLPVVNFDVTNLLAMASAVEDGYRQPERAVRRFDAVAITPAVLVELDIIVVDEDVGTPHLVEETKPGQVAGLKNSKDCHDN